MHYRNAQEGGGTSSPNFPVHFMGRTHGNRLMCRAVGNQEPTGTDRNRQAPQGNGVRDARFRRSSETACFRSSCAINSVTENYGFGTAVRTFLGVLGWSQELLRALQRALRGCSGVLGGAREVLGGSSGTPRGLLGDSSSVSGSSRGVRRGHWRSSGGPRGSSGSPQGALGGPSEVLGGPRGALGANLGGPRALLGTSECGLKIIEKTLVFLVFPAI